MDLQQRLQEYMGEADAPGAVVGVLENGQIQAWSAGVLNIRTGVEATTDSVFQIGSNTKVWTATQVMQLVDEGLVELDAPVREYLPTFNTAVPGLSARLTVRHLLTHTSGIDGDLFENFGRNDDAIERYVASLSSLGSVHEPGQLWSYCNSGFVVAGHIVEVVRGKPWAASLRETVGEPLGLDALCFDADEAILHRAAAGHTKRPGQDEIIVDPVWSLPAAVGPAGAVLTTTAHDVLAFVRMHLSEGKAPDDTAVLSPESVRAMQTPQVECPAAEVATHWGLGWFIQVVDAGTVIGHGGGTTGQTMHCYVVPDSQVAVALLTNSSSIRPEASLNLVRDVLAELAGVQLPHRPEPSEQPSIRDLSRFAGSYKRLGVEVMVEPANGLLRATLRGSGRYAVLLGMDKTITFDLSPVDGDETLFVTNIPQFGTAWIPIRFVAASPDGDVQFLHMQLRASRRDG